MPLRRVGLAEEDGIIAPAHAVRAHPVGKPPEAVDHGPLVRHVRLDLPAVGRDGHVPELPEGREKIHVREHGRGILRAEADDIHHRRVQPVPADLLTVKGIPHADKAFPQAIGKPLRVEGRDICPLAGIDNHGTTFLFLPAAALRSAVPDAQKLP